MASTLPPDLFDNVTIYSLASTVLIAVAGIVLAKVVLPASTPASKRFLFIWHTADALCHTFIEGSFLYHCLFSYQSMKDITNISGYYPTPLNYLGTNGRVYGPQAGGDSPTALLWMVYARADKRWGGIDLGVVSLELLTVFVDVPLCLMVLYCLVKQDPRANIWMIVLATAELYGTWMTFAPEWLVGSINLDTSNFMYYWVYLWFFNGIWVVIPVYAIIHSIGEITDAFKAKAAKGKVQ